VCVAFDLTASNLRVRAELEVTRARTYAPWPLPPPLTLTGLVGGMSCGWEQGRGGLCAGGPGARARGRTNRRCAQANSRNASFEGQDLHLLRPGVKNPYMAVAEKIGECLLACLDGDRRVPVLGFGDCKSVETPSKTLWLGEGVGVRGVLDVYESALALFERPDTGLAFSGPTSFVGPIRFAMQEAEKHPDRISVAVIITDGAINDAPRVFDHASGRSTVDLTKSPTVAAIRDAANLPLYILIVGVGDGPFEQLRVLDDFLPERRIDAVQAVIFTEFQGRMQGSADALDEFARLALCELPLFLDDLARKGFVAPHAPVPHIPPLRLDSALPHIYLQDKV
jgi:hypothetical protein